MGGAIMAWNEVFKDTITGVTQDSDRNHPAVSFSRDSSFNGILSERSTSTYMAFGGFDGKVYIYNTSDWSLDTSFSPDGTSDDIKDIDFMNGTFIGVLQGDTVYIYDGGNDWELDESLQVTSKMTNLSFSYTRRDSAVYLAVGGLHEYDEESLFFFKDTYDTSGFELDDSNSDLEVEIWEIEWEPGLPRRVLISGRRGYANFWIRDHDNNTWVEDGYHQFYTGSNEISISPKACHRIKSGEANGYGYMGVGAILDTYYDVDNIYLWGYEKDGSRNSDTLDDWSLDSYRYYNKIRLSNDLNWLTVSEGATIYVFEPLYNEYDRENQVEDSFTVEDPETLNMNFSCDTNWFGVVSWDDHNEEQTVQIYSVPTPSYNINGQVNGTEKSLDVYPLENNQDYSRETGNILVLRSKHRYAIPHIVSPGDSNDSGVHIGIDGSPKAWAEE